MIKNFSLKTLLTFLILFISFTMIFATNSQIDNLINSYNYDFTTNQINITNTQESSLDSNNNQIIDTIKFEFTTNVSNSNYYLIMNIQNELNSISEYTKITSNNPTIEISSHNLNQNQFNYSIEIRDENFNLLYSKYNLTSNLYQNLENPIEISQVSTSTSQEGLNFNFDIVSNTNQESQIKLYLSYINLNNQTKTIIEEIQTNMTTSQTSLNIQIPNEKIKLTHHKGVYMIEKLEFNKKIFQLNQTTNSYDFENFAQTSYFRELNYIYVDSNNDSIYENLDLNLNSNIKEQDTYSINVYLYDEYNNFVLQKEENLTLSQSSNQTSLIQISTKDLYENSKLSSFYVKSIILKQNNQIIDILEPKKELINSVSRENFEKPAMPDLTTNIENIYFNESSNESSFLVQILNQGQAPAFNINYQIFSQNYYLEDKITFLDINETLNLELKIENSTKGQILTILVDSLNSNEEVDKYNNINQDYLINSQDIKVNTKISQLNENITEIQVQNLAPIPLYDLNLNFANFSYENFDLYKQESKVFLIKNNLEQNSSTNFTLINEKINISYIYSIGLANISINSTLLKSELNSFIVEHRIKNNDLNKNSNLVFGDLNLNLNPNQTIFIIEKIDSVLLKEISKNNIQEIYNFSNILENYQNIDLTNISHIIKTLNFENSSVLEIILVSDNNISNFDFELEYNNSHSINLNNLQIKEGNNYYLIEYKPQENPIKVILDSISYNSNIYNYNANDLLLKNFNVIQTSSNKYLYEIHFYNEFLTQKEVSFSLGDNSYSSTLMENERKVYLLEENQADLQIEFN